jgi:hypothetical protein
MIILKGRVLGDVNLHRVLSRLVDETHHLEPVFEKIGDDFRDITVNQFAAQGYGWAPLTPRYAAWKAAHFPGKPILQREGRLLAAMTIVGNEDNVNEVAPLWARFGAGGEVGLIGSFHQTGTYIMAQRKVIDLREEDKRRFTKTFHVHFLRLGAQLGFIEA